MIRRITHVLLACCAVGLLLAMQKTTPEYMELTGPIPVDGVAGETVSARLFDLRVDKVVFARQLRFERFGGEEIRTTPGVWAIVTVMLAARERSTAVFEAAWQGPTGLLYRHTDRLLGFPNLPPHHVDPGLPRRGWLVFEIRPDQALGATLLVSSQASPRLDSEVRIALDSVDRRPDGSPVVLDTFDANQPMSGV